MTRRKFLSRFGVAVSAICGGLCRMGRRSLPRRVVRADRLETYPGAIVPMGDIGTQSKWSG